MRSLLLLFLGVPIPIIILIALFMHWVLGRSGRGSRRYPSLLIAGKLRSAKASPLVATLRYASNRFRLACSSGNTPLGWSRYLSRCA